MGKTDSPAIAEAVLTMFLHQAVQATISLRAEVETLKARIAALEAAAVRTPDEGWGG